MGTLLFLMGYLKLGYIENVFTEPIITAYICATSVFVVAL